MQQLHSILIARLFLAACGSADDEKTQPETEVTKSANEAPSVEAEPKVEEAAAPAVAAASSGKEKPAAFVQCQACHTVDEGGRNGIGPNLWAVAGTQAGTRADFNYSKAMAESGLNWDDATLDSYLENPRKVVPGTKMAYAGLRKPEQRAEVLAFLKSLK